MVMRQGVTDAPANSPPFGPCRCYIFATVLIAQLASSSAFRIRAIPLRTLRVVVRSGSCGFGRNQLTGCYRGCDGGIAVPGGLRRLRWSDFSCQK